jgi:hypothetical protein
MFDHYERELLADGLRATYRDAMNLADNSTLADIYVPRMAELETLFAKLHEGDMTGRYTLAEFWAKVAELQTADN